MSKTGLRYPDFFIVGAGKAGTTALWKYLSHHPQVYMTRDIRYKELAFFSDHYGVSDEQQYLSFFSEAKTNQLIGESCHTYITAPESPERIYKKLPDAKIIIMLRDPVKRAYSLYNWMVMQGNEKMANFAEVVAAEPHRINDPAFIKWATPYYFRNFFYMNSGLYAHQVEPYLRLFGDRCRVYFFEEFNQNHATILEDICSLLKIQYDPALSLTRENESRVPRSIKLQFYLRNDFQWKLNKMGFSKKRAAGVTDFFIRMNTAKKKPAKLKQEEYIRYREFFKDDIRALGQLLNKDLDKIWKY